MKENRSLGVVCVMIFIVALGLSITGYIVSHSTYLIPYRTASNEQVQNYVAPSASNGNMGYLRLKGDSAIYLVPANEMTPKFTSKSYAKASRISLTALPDSTGDVDLKASRTLELKGLGYRVIALVVKTNNKSTNFVTQAFTASPDGILHDNSANGYQLLTAGLIAIAIFAMLTGALGRTSGRVIFEDIPWLRVPTLSGVITGIVIGIYFLMISFPLAAANIGTAMGWPLVHDVGITIQADLTSIFGASEAQRILSFDDLWSTLVIGLGIYFAALALISLRHLRLDLLGLGVVFVALGISAIHMLAWVITILLWIIGVIFAIIYWISQIFGGILSWFRQLLAPIFAWLGQILGAIFGFIANLIALLFSSGWWAILILVLLAGAIYLAIRYREFLLEFLEETWPFLLAAAIVTAIIVFLVKVWAFLAPIFEVLGRILAVIFQILGYILIVVLVGWLFYGLGGLLLDQFKGAWHAGNGRRGVILGSLAVGISVALILLESNLYGVVAYLPSAFADFATTNLHQSNPIVDILLALLVLAVSILGILRNLPQLLEELDLEEFQTEIFMTGIALFVVLFVLLPIASRLNTLTGDSA